MDEADRSGSAGEGGASVRADRGTFADLFQGSFRVLWLIARSGVENRELAEDVIQEAAIIALGKFNQFRQGTNFSAWMGQVVRHVAQNMSRKEGRRRALSIDVHPASPELLHDPPPGMNERSAVTERGGLARDQAHFDDQVSAALRDLSETARACLLLRTIEGLEYSEISELLDVPKGTAMSHVHRAREALRERLLMEGYLQGARGGIRS